MNDITKETPEQREAAELRYRLVKACTCGCLVSAHAYGDGQCDFCYCRKFVLKESNEN